MIRLKLTVWNTLIVVIVACGLSGLIVAINRSNLYRSVDDELLARATRLRKMSHEVVLPTDPTLPALRMAFGTPKTSESNVQREQFVALQQEIFVPRLFDENGKPRPVATTRAWDAVALQRVRTENRLEIFSNAVWPMSGTDARGTNLRIITISLDSKNPDIRYAQFAYDLAQIEEEMNHLNRTVLSALPIAILAALAIGVLLTDRALRPVRLVTAAARELRTKSIQDRLPVNGDDEIAQLSKLINQSFDRNEESYSRLLRFTADASHELRSPLTSILARAYTGNDQNSSNDVLLEKLDAIHRSALDMSKIIDDLLFLARLDEGIPLPTSEELSLSEVIGTVSDRFVNIVGDRLQLTLDGPLRMKGDRASLERLFRNLVENSAKYGSENGPIEVVGRKTGDTIYVEVIDSGPGIPAQDVDRVFDRFYRADLSRTRKGGRGGAGLGLNICKGIVDAHRGTIALRSVLGEGTIVQISFPLSG